MASDSNSENGFSTPFCMFLSLIIPIMGLILFCLYPNEDKGKLSLLTGLLSFGICYAFISKM